jgi:uncharacterized protein (DUF111 family)
MAPTDLETARAVLQKHKQEILAKYRAVGVGIGKDDPASPNHVIVVYLKTAENKPREKVEVDGVLLKFEVTGEIKLFR